MRLSQCSLVGDIHCVFHWRHFWIMKVVPRRFLLRRWNASFPDPLLLRAQFFDSRFCYNFQKHQKKPNPLGASDQLIIYLETSRLWPGMRLNCSSGRHDGCLVSPLGFHPERIPVTAPFILFYSLMSLIRHWSSSFERMMIDKSEIPLRLQY